MTQKTTFTEISEYDAAALNFLLKTGSGMATAFVRHGQHFVTDKQDRDIYRVTIMRGNKSFSIQFGQSLKDSTGNGGHPPTAYDVLSCITKSDPGTLEDFCGEMGYDLDSWSARQVYKAVVKEWKQVSRLFTAEEIEWLSEIQ